MAATPVSLSVRDNLIGEKLRDRALQVNLRRYKDAMDNLNLDITKVNSD